MIKLAIYFRPLDLLLLCAGFLFVLIAIESKKAEILDIWPILIKKEQGQHW